MPVQIITPNREDAFQDVDYSSAVEYGVNVIKYLIKNPLPKGSFLNINVPHKPAKLIKGLKITRQGMVPIHGKFSERTNPYGAKYLWMSGIVPRKGKDLRIDTNALLDDYVTVTPLHCDQTDYKSLDQLTAKNLQF